MRRTVTFSFTSALLAGVATATLMPASADAQQYDTGQYYPSQSYQGYQGNLEQQWTPSDRYAQWGAEDRLQDQRQYGQTQQFGPEDFGQAGRYQTYGSRQQYGFAPYDPDRRNLQYGSREQYGFPPYSEESGPGGQYGGQQYGQIAPGAGGQGGPQGYGSQEYGAQEYGGYAMGQPGYGQQYGMQGPRGPYQQFGQLDRMRQHHAQMHGAQMPRMQMPNMQMYGQQMYGQMPGQSNFMTGQTQADLYAQGNQRQGVSVPDAGKIIVTSASDLVGRSARDLDGKPVGQVEYIMINALTGDVGYVILGTGRGLDIGADYVAVPWSAVVVRPGDARRLVVNVSRDRLKQAPRLSGDELAKLTNPTLLAYVTNYYAVPEGQGSQSGGQTRMGQAQASQTQADQTQTSQTQRSQVQSSQAGQTSGSQASGGQTGQEQTAQEQTAQSQQSMPAQQEQNQPPAQQASGEQSQTQGQQEVHQLARALRQADQALEQDDTEAAQQALDQATQSAQQAIQEAMELSSDQRQQRLQSVFGSLQWAQQALQQNNPKLARQAIAEARQPLRQLAAIQQGSQGQRDWMQQMMQQGGGTPQPAILVGRRIITMLHPPVLTSPSDLRGTSVLAANGQPIGQIDQVMIDLERGHIAFVLLASGGFLGMDQVWAPVPFQTLEWVPEAQAYLLEADPRQLQAMPTLPEDRLPVAVSSRDLAMLYGQFGVAPYWQSSTALAATQGQGSMMQGGMMRGGMTQGAMIDPQELRQMLQRQGFTEISDLSRDGGTYEVTAKRDGQAYDLEIDAGTGIIQNSRLTTAQRP